MRQKGILNSFKKVVNFSALIFIGINGILFSQSNKYLIYVSENIQNSSNLTIFDTTTSETKILTHFNDEGKIGNISTDETGLKIIFTRPSSDNGKANSTIWCLNYDGSGLTDLIEGNENIDYKYAAISPDGKKIAYCANSSFFPNSYQVYVMDIKTKLSIQLTNFQPHIECSFPSFIDNETVIFKKENINDNLQEYYKVNINSGNLTNLTNNSQLSPYFPRLGRPFLNIERNKIIYGKQKNTNGNYSNWEIYFYDISSGSEQLLITNLYYGTIQPENQVDPQPCFIDNGQIAFIGTKTGNSYEIYITSAPKVNPYFQRITYNTNPYLPYYFEISSLPTKFTYVDNQGKIYLVDSTGTETFIDYGNNPSFDERGIYLTYLNNGIKMIRLPDKITTTIESVLSSDFPVFSPDGKWILYIKNNDIYGNRLIILPRQDLQILLTLKKQTYVSLQTVNISFILVLQMGKNTFINYLFQLLINKE